MFSTSTRLTFNHNKYLTINNYLYFINKYFYINHLYKRGSPYMYHTDLFYLTDSNRWHCHANTT